MSLVGTRPPTVDEWDKYELHHRARLATKPGLTGMWQVSGRSNITDFEEVVKLDKQYISELDENSIRPRENWFDLKGFDKKGKFQAATWEGCVVRLADKIAYLGRDIEDAIRLNYLSAKDKEFLQDMARVHNESAINTTVIMCMRLMHLKNYLNVKLVTQYRIINNRRWSVSEKFI